MWMTWKYYQQQIESKAHNFDINYNKIQILILKSKVTPESAMSNTGVSIKMIDQGLFDSKTINEGLG